jgi:hypothetical protein
MDDDFLDPAVFAADSVLGVPGLFEVYRSGRVALANAPGHRHRRRQGDLRLRPADREVLPDEDIILPNVPTFLCAYDDQRQHVLANLESLVVKAANESGGYGMLVGPHSTGEERAEFAKRIEASPRNYIAQPTLSLSRVPTIVDGAFHGRHVDLRPYALYGEDIFVLPGGLTRVALRPGSLVVNSSQGGAARTRGSSPTTAARRTSRSTAGTGFGNPGAESVAVLSRVADSIYWMSRYIERADNVAALRRRDAQPDPGHAGRLGPAVAAAGRHDGRRGRVHEAVRHGDAAARHPVPDLRSRTTPARSCRACAPPAKTPARSARSSPRTCGSR